MITTIDRVDPPLTGIAAGVWHAVEHVWPPAVPGDPRHGLAVCGRGGVTVAEKFGVFDPARYRDRTCHECVWAVAIRAGTLDAELARLDGADSTGPQAAHRSAPQSLAVRSSAPQSLAARVARAIVARSERDDPATVQLLGAVSAHAPTRLIAGECAEGGCEHPDRQRCPTVAVACLTCSQLTGGWAGEWEGMCMPECTVTAPCEVLRTLAAHYRIHPATVEHAARAVVEAWDEGRFRAGPTGDALLRDLQAALLAVDTGHVFGGGAG